MSDRPTHYRKRNLAVDIHAEAKPGCCSVCDRPLPPRSRKLCGAKECSDTYQRLYNAGWKRLKRAEQRRHF